MGGLTGLWRDPEFLKLWSGRTVSRFGSQVTRVALPLAAVLVLGATPLQMGVLRALASTPDFVLGLVAGAWADRVRRRPLLIGADLCQAVVIGWVPVADLVEGNSKLAVSCSLRDLLGPALGAQATSSSIMRQAGLK